MHFLILLSMANTDKTLHFRLWETNPEVFDEFTHQAKELGSIDIYEDLADLQVDASPDDIIVFEYEKQSKYVDKAIKKLKSSSDKIKIIIIYSNELTKKIIKHQKSKYCADFYLNMPLSLELLASVLGVNLVEEEEIDLDVDQAPQLQKIPVLKEQELIEDKEKEELTIPSLPPMPVLENEDSSEPIDPEPEKEMSSNKDDELNIEQVESVGDETLEELLFEDQEGLSFDETDSNAISLDDGLELTEEDVNLDLSSDEEDIDLDLSSDEEDDSLDLSLGDNEDALDLASDDDVEELDLSGSQDEVDLDLGEDISEDNGLDLSQTDDLSSVDLDFADETEADLSITDDANDTLDLSEELSLSEESEDSLDLDLGEEVDIDQSEDLDFSIGDDSLESEPESLEMSGDNSLEVDDDGGLELDGNDSGLDLDFGSVEEDNSSSLEIQEEDSSLGLGDELDLSSADELDLSSPDELDFANDEENIESEIEDELDFSANDLPASPVENEEYSFESPSPVTNSDHTGDLSEDALAKLAEIDQMLQEDATAASISTQGLDELEEEEVEYDPTANQDIAALNSVETKNIISEPEETNIIETEPVVSEEHSVALKSSDIDSNEIYNEELLRLSETISLLRKDRESLIDKLKEYEKMENKTQSEESYLRAQYDEKKIELSVTKKRFEGRVSEFEKQISLLTQKNDLYSEKIKRLEHENHNLQQEKNIDLAAVRNREKELESQLELLRADSSAQITNRDQKILQLKRRVDTLEFDLDAIQVREKRMSDDQFAIEDRMEKVINTLRHAIGDLEEDSTLNTKLYNNAKKNVDL